MKPMIWHPEDKDAAVNQYLEQLNHAPYSHFCTALRWILLVYISCFVRYFLRSLADQAIAQETCWKPE